MSNLEVKPRSSEHYGQTQKAWQRRPIKSLAHGHGSLFLDGDWIESKNLSTEGIRYLTTGNVGDGFYKEQGSGFIREPLIN
jgi:type I restriction enzyme S subunit